MAEENNDKLENDKKIGFFKKLLKSIKDFDKYEDFAMEKTSEAFKYILKLVALFSAIICIAYTYKIMDTINDAYTVLKEKIPEFSYEGGILKADSKDPTIIEDYGEVLGTVIIDTKSNTDKIKDKYEKQIDKYGVGILFTKDSLVLTNNNATADLTYKYSDVLGVYGIQSANKGQVIDNIENINIVSSTLSIYLFTYLFICFIPYFISIMIDVLLLSCIAYIITRFSRIKLKFAPAFNIAVHSITLPVILNLVYIIVRMFTGFEIKHFDIMYNTISYIYVIVAILMIKTDFMNRQMELIKIAQEQMKIKEELKKQEEKKEEEQKENKEVGKDDENQSSQKDEKENTEKKQKNKKDDKSSDEPLGNATFDIDK